MINVNMSAPSSSVDVPRQSNNMTETPTITQDTDLDFLNLKEVAIILRVAPISIYRLIAKRTIPVYRACRKILFKKQDVIAYLEQHRKDPLYGSKED
jgi:excisionase family DNA binding protein